MGLLDRSSRFDRWPELERARNTRYWDALVLSTDSLERGTGAIYLFGYVAELALKAAYYRVRGIDPAVNVAKELKGMAQRAKALGFRWSRNRHNIVSLASLLIRERVVRGRPMDAGMAGVLLIHAHQIQENWHESLRYREIDANAFEIDSVYASADWFHSNYNAFWS